MSDFSNKKIDKILTRFFELCDLDGQNLESYVNKVCDELDRNANECEEVSLGNESIIYNNWINSDVTYLPSGERSKGFKLDRQVIIEFLTTAFTKKNKFYELKDKFFSNTLSTEEKNYLIGKVEGYLVAINLFPAIYFGPSCEDEKRKQIFGYGSLNSAGQTLNLSELKGQNVARCIEKASTVNALLNFLGYDSSLVLSDASLGEETTGHAYCLIDLDDKYKILDPTFIYADQNKKGNVYIFDLDEKNEKCEFDPKTIGGEGYKVVYDFPFDKIKKHKIESKDSVEKKGGTLMYDKNLSEKDISAIIDDLRRDGANPASFRECHNMYELLYRKRKADFDTTFGEIEKAVRQDPTLLDCPEFSFKYSLCERLDYDCASNYDVVARLANIKRASRNLEFMQKFISMDPDTRKNSYEHFEGSHISVLSDIEEIRKANLEENNKEIGLLDSKVATCVRNIQIARRDNPKAISSYQENLAELLESLYLRKKFNIDMKVKQSGLDMPDDFAALNDDNVYVKGVSARIDNIKKLDKIVDSMLEVKKTETVLKENEAVIQQTQQQPVLQQPTLEQPLVFEDYNSYTTTGRLR